MSYRGRFAPTPSGPLHMGSLFTALASYLQARARGGQWLIRIDDLDIPRNVPGADTAILKQLESHGLQWDEAPRYQSQYIQQYQHALNVLTERKLLYGCTCTRAELAATTLAGPDGPVYAGTCRDKSVGAEKHSLRVRADDSSLSFVDLLLGEQTRQLHNEIGDFVVQRSDGILGYQLACAVDEFEQGITEVIRGADLLDSTFRQLYLQQLLGLKPAQYGHLPVLVQNDGKKLSKQNHAAPIDAKDAPSNLLQCLTALGQNPPTSLFSATPADILNWATQQWDIAHIPKKTALQWSNSPASGIL
ncbi:tRNA glutamyl-Q(34) synthetase GluQRS [Stenotrophobium rhamnosiphilum]|uniref:Glutamyl-Q tRNA(Asp) synthetase n=1 Tax=Stenotrophobium rhamnosiphilum TaxID=2029166 RepID=A0A2T5MHN3_9GAMM|nr:tRNA glutamyl-Q(34) synthetase GluQRS [Stenotrophobium rhamnosiphilum]PTU32049.1 tRNA glutamyl-Q(34) synthetase GluQRS [Stenotrophobium rhamnosiphilum]